MKAMSLSNLYSRTGCLPKCAQTKYKFNPKKSTPITWRSSSISSFYLTAESDQVEEQVEYLVYDMQVQAIQTTHNYIKESRQLEEPCVYLLAGFTPYICTMHMYDAVEMNCRTCGAMLVAIWDSFLAGSPNTIIKIITFTIIICS